MHLVLQLAKPVFNKVGQGKLGCCPVLNKQLNKCLFSTELVEVEWMKILPWWGVAVVDLVGLVTGWGGLWWAGLVSGWGGLVCGWAGLRWGWSVGL